MKNLLLIIALLFAVSSFAGTCFKADNQIAAEAKIPSVICVDSFKFETIKPGLPRAPFYKATVETSVGKKSEQVTFYEYQRAPYTIAVEFLLNEIDEGTCFYSYRSKVVVVFKVDAEGKTIEESLNVAGVEEETPDNCHSEDRVRLHSFSKI